MGSPSRSRAGRGARRRGARGGARAAAAGARRSLAPVEPLAGGQHVGGRGDRARQLARGALARSEPLPGELDALDRQQATADLQVAGGGRASRSPSSWLEEVFEIEVAAFEDERERQLREAGAPRTRRRARRRARECCAGAAGPPGDRGEFDVLLVRMPARAGRSATALPGSAAPLCRGSRPRRRRPRTATARRARSRPCLRRSRAAPGRLRPARSSSLRLLALGRDDQHPRGRRGPRRPRHDHDDAVATGHLRAHPRGRGGRREPALAESETVVVGRRSGPPRRSAADRR